MSVIPRIPESLFSRVIKAVEQTELDYRGVRQGAIRRQIAIDIINAVVDIPVLPEWVEQRVFGLLVDFAVYLYNRAFGHSWGRRVTSLDPVPATDEGMGGA